jgi:serine/threonine-protein kinase
MGIVYLALSGGPGGFAKLKVVKRLRAELAEEPRARQMFLDEARLAARLLHPNIVQTNEVAFDGKHYFLEMEYLEGQSLDSLLRRARAAVVAVPLPVVVWILSQTLAGLHYAHELTDLDGTPLHVVHRDVSPHNVFVTYEGHVKVLDFGIAKAADSQDETTTGAIKGKVTYMAPEQAARGSVDRRADLFAVGIMLWQALAGKRLWEGLGDFEIFLRLQEGKIPRPCEVQADAPAELETICMRALAHEPADRYATAAEMQAALDAYLDASGARVGVRVLARLMSDLFGETRARVKAEIEARIKGSPGEGPTLEVPVLAAGPTTTGTGTAAGQTRTTTAERENATARRGRRRLRTMTLVAAFIAVAAGGGAALLGARRGETVASRDRASAAATALECTINRDCASAHPGAPWICRKDLGRCFPLESDECKVLADPADVENDATLWLGSMYPTTGPKASYGVVAARGADLARRDFMQIAHGLPSLEWNGPVRPVGLLACNDADQATRAAHHLADDVGVAAVMGFGSSQEAIDLATTVFIPKHVLVATENRSPLISAIPHPPGERHLVFRAIMTEAAWSIPPSLIVPEVLEPRLVKAGIVGPSAPMRVALIRPESTAGLSAAEHIFENLRFNGKSALENGEGYRQFVYKDGDHAAEAVAALVAFRPHVVIFFGQNEVVTPVLEPIERTWRRDVRYRPFFVSNSSLVGDDMVRLVGTNAERRHRFFGLAPPSTTLANARMTMRYNEVFPSEPVTPGSSPGASYDAFYLLAYAAIASGGRTGTELAGGIGQLVPPGVPIDVGATQILQAVEALRTAKRFDLDGIMTRMDFDLQTGESKGDLVVTCFGVDDAGRARDSVDSGLRYDARTGQLTGSLSCP